jgi:alcohol dehydrogenase class IV
MPRYIIDLPFKLAFGAGKLKDVGDEVASYGKKVFIVIDPYLRGSDTENQIQDNLKRNGLDYITFDDISPNPRCWVVDRGADMCKAEACDVVLAIGGGSTIDTAKAIAITSVNGEDSWLYTSRVDEYVAEIKNPALPLIAIPTTSGTGTETTPYSVLNNPEVHSKATIVSDYCFPKVSIVDPELMVSMPPMITALTGIDAFAHALEAYTSTISTPFIDMVALEAIRLFAENIKECCNNGSNIEARENMAWASTLGGIAIARCTTTLPHALGQALAGLTDAPHGGSIACCIGRCIEWALPNGEEKFAKIAQIFDPSLASASVSERAAALPEILDKLWLEILNQNVTMSTYGLKEDQIEELAYIAYSTLYGGIKVFPRVASKSELVELIKKCM